MKCTLWIKEEILAEALTDQLCRIHLPTQIHRLRHASDLLVQEEMDGFEQVCFLQINESDLEVINQLMLFERVPLFVFVLSENATLKRSLDVASMEYLMWPWSMIDVRNLILRLYDLKEMKTEYNSFGRNYKSAIQFFVAAVRNGLNGEIILPDVKGYKQFPFSSMARLESEGPYTHVFTVDGDRVLTNKPLRHYDNILDPLDFVRIQINQMINLNCMKHWKMDKDLIVTLKDDSEWKVSFRWVPLFINAVNARSKNGLA